MLDITMHGYLIGLTVKGANRIGGMVYAVRATQGPNGPFVVTQDYRQDRINVAVDAEGKITQLLNIG